MGDLFSIVVRHGGFVDQMMTAGCNGPSVVRDPGVASSGSDELTFDSLESAVKTAAAWVAIWGPKYTFTPVRRVWVARWEIAEPASDRERRILVGSVEQI